MNEITKDFWRIRSKKYDKLYWANNTSYIDKIKNNGTFYFYNSIIYMKS